MRQDWEPEDLTGVWTLLEDDMKKVRNKSGATRLGFALLLKFFEVEARFPKSAKEMPAAAVEYVAQQVKVGAAACADYDWQGDRIKRHRKEIHEGLQVVENGNSANKDLFYGKDGDPAGADKESQEVSMLAPHLLQSALVHVDTLLTQEVPADAKWADKPTDADRRALSPLFWTQVNRYGRFELDMNSRLDPDLSIRATVPGPRTTQDEAAGVSA
ncbi:Tn3 family transposase [Streptomyces sp. NPDC007088]|uniref:Tn3 family transposase n=1 Tax=Streptomyces sp. NPDC007088 TaxID=3364773 RepID=UPI0036925DAA